MAMEIPILASKYIFKWTIFHCHVSLPEVNCCLKASNLIPNLNQQAMSPFAIGIRSRDRTFKVMGLGQDEFPRPVVCPDFFRSDTNNQTLTKKNMFW